MKTSELLIFVLYSAPAFSRPLFLEIPLVPVMQAAKPLFDYPKYWAECFGPAPSCL